MQSLAEQLNQEIYNENICVDEHEFSNVDLDGMYHSADYLASPVISINTRSVKTTAHQNYVKAHELGHHHNCICNLFEAPTYIRQKYELLADRDWVERILTPERIVQACSSGVRNPFELAEYLEIPIAAVNKGLEICFQIHGCENTYYEQYIICWNPLTVKIDT
ncbi:MAG: hypothetical protein RR449_01725 [Christensenella sp.]